MKPALSPEEWQGILSNTDRLEEIKAGFSKGPTYCAKMATDHAALGDEATANTFRTLGQRHEERAAKIAALLPPL